MLLCNGGCCYCCVMERVVCYCLMQRVVGSCGMKTELLLCTGAFIVAL